MTCDNGVRITGVAERDVVCDVKSVSPKAQKALYRKCKRRRQIQVVKATDRWGARAGACNKEGVNRGLWHARSRRGVTFHRDGCEKMTEVWGGEWRVQSMWCKRQPGQSGRVPSGRPWIKRVVKTSKQVVQQKLH